MKNKLRVLVVNEKTALDSILSDVFTFGSLFGGFFLNHYFLGGSIVLHIMFAVMFLILISSHYGKKIKTMNCEEALEYLSRLRDKEK